MADFVRAEWPANSSYTIDSSAHDTATYLAEEAFEQSTRDAYDRAARAFDDWLGGARASDAALAEYIGALFNRGLAVASAETAVAALKDRARRTGVACPAGERTRQTLCGYRRAGAGRGLGQVDGLSWEQADRMAGLAEQRGTGGLRDALLVRIMSDCLLRGAEAVALDVSDIAFADGWLRVYLRRSKTDQEGQGVVFYAGEETARLARRWLKAAGIAGGPLFRPVNKAGRAAETRLTVRSVRSIVKRCAENAGIGGRVSGHSLRIGAAQSLRAAGATMVDLMAAGRWKRADTVAHYTREQDAASGAVACLRYGAVPLPLRRRATMPVLLCEPGVTRREWKRQRKNAKRARKAERRAQKKAQKALARA